MCTCQAHEKIPMLSHHTPIRAWSASQLGEELWPPQTWRPLKWLTVHPSHTHDPLQVAVQERETMSTKRSTGNIPERRKLAMIANLDCSTCPHQESTKTSAADMTVRDFLNWSFEVRRPTLNVGRTYIKEHGGRKLFWFCPLALTLAGIRTYFTIPTQNISSSREILWDSSTRLGLLRHPASWTKKHMDPWPLHGETVYKLFEYILYFIYIIYIIYITNIYICFISSVLFL